MKRQIVVSVLILMACFISAARAEKRVALVVGNSTYRNVAPLENPANDAALMAETLKGLGFDLVGNAAQLDLDKNALDNSVQSFGRQIQGADVAMFYYAGHGLQVRGSNYLVPIDANPIREADVDFQMLDLSFVMNQMQGSGTRLNLLVLDACRNNPFIGRELRSSESGLAQILVPEGTLISYATQPGNVAQDGHDGHSPYTRALAATMKRSELDLFETFNEVGLSVKRLTGGSQQPWVSSSPIEGTFYFSNPPISGSSATDCDRLAGNPTDSMHLWDVTGVRTAQIAIAPALAACNAAMRRYPDVARFTYQAGRVAFAQKDYGLARQLFEKAANAGYPASYYDLGILYAQGNGVPKDLAEARKWYEKAAAANEASGMMALGNLYFAGSGVPRNFDEARKWYDKAAAAGAPGGMNGLGRMYMSGNGVTRDYSEARRWFEKAAALGGPAAMANLGDIYRDGRGVPRDLSQARMWYEKSAANGMAHAMVRLGDLYRQGVGVAQDSAQASKWYEMAAAADDASGMTALGNLYFQGDGIPKDFVEARKWYERAAAADEPGGMNGLGSLYLSGSGLPRDYAEARKWFEKAAALGGPAAMANLGNIYRDGTGVAKDFSLARSWYEKSAAGGVSYAMMRLGDMYLNGMGVAQDLVQARKWYEMAAAAGNPDAAKSIGQMSAVSQK